MKTIAFVYLLILPFLVQSQSKKWEQLFDGKTLKGWSVKAGTADYQVVDRTIVIDYNRKCNRLQCQRFDINDGGASIGLSH